MDDKRFNSDVESGRLPTEEPVRTSGENISPRQIWRDGALIPPSPKDLEFVYSDVTDKNGTYIKGEVCFSDGQTVNKLVEHIKALSLTLQTGTLNVYSNALLKNLIGREFDGEDTTEADSWQYQLTVDGTKVAYGMGNPLIDNAAGTIIFRDKDFAESLQDKTLYISFYRYAGRVGFIGDNGIDLPFRDDLKHFKDTRNDNRTATFVVRGDEGNTQYILPAAGAGFHGNDETVKGRKGVIMLEENYNDIVWNIGVHNGGLFLNDGSVVKDN